MLQLPPGFNLSALVSDYQEICSYFLGIVGLFVAYRVYKKITGNIK